MTRNQLHGKRFEDIIKGCGQFDGSSDSSRPINSIFDIEARFDRAFGLPTSIKASGRGIIALADARKFWRIDEAFRLLVGRFEQRVERKVFQEVHEFLLDRNILATLRGQIANEEVARVHRGLDLTIFPRGQHARARAWVKAELAAMRDKSGLVKLNPKIDSGSQRRLQCSVQIDGLIRMSASAPIFVTAGGDQAPTHRIHRENIGTLALPFALVSPSRKFEAKGANG